MICKERCESATYIEKSVKYENSKNIVKKKTLIKHVVKNVVRIKNREEKIHFFKFLRYFVIFF